MTRHRVTSYLGLVEPQAGHPRPRLARITSPLSDSTRSDVLIALAWYSFVILIMIMGIASEPRWLRFPVVLVVVMLIANLWRLAKLLTVLRRSR